MARRAREKSKSGIYHIIMRGINRQVIFEEEEDKQKFLECLSHYKDICNYKIYGYCLMDTHIHLLIKESEEDIAAIMKRISVRYAVWYNRKYDRCGHLFQDRFKSENVEDEAYLLAVLRYIHQNPLKATMVEDLGAYRESSYREFIDTAKIVDSEFILRHFSHDRSRAMQGFVRFMSESVEDEPRLEYREQRKLKDEMVRKLIQEYAKVSSPIEIQAMNKSERDELLRGIKKMDGVSTWQIARLTGISQSVIARA